MSVGFPETPELTADQRELLLQLAEENQGSDIDTFLGIVTALDHITNQSISPETKTRIMYIKDLVAQKGTEGLHEDAYVAIMDAIHIVASDQSKSRKNKELDVVINRIAENKKVVTVSRVGGTVAFMGWLFTGGETTLEYAYALSGLKIKIAQITHYYGVLFTTILNFASNKSPGGMQALYLLAFNTDTDIAAQRAKITAQLTMNPLAGVFFEMATRNEALGMTIIDVMVSRAIGGRAAGMSGALISLIPGAPQVMSALLPSVVTKTIEASTISLVTGGGGVVPPLATGEEAIESFIETIADFVPKVISDVGRNPQLVSQYKSSYGDEVTRVADSIEVALKNANSVTTELPGTLWWFFVILMVLLVAYFMWFIFRNLRSRSAKRKFNDLGHNFLSLAVSAEEYQALHEPKHLHHPFELIHGIVTPERQSPKRARVHVSSKSPTHSPPRRSSSPPPPYSPPRSVPKRSHWETEMPRVSPPKRPRWGHVEEIPRREISPSEGGWVRSPPRGSSARITEMHMTRGHGCKRSPRRR